MVERYGLAEDFFELASDDEDDTLNFGNLEDRRASEEDEVTYPGGDDLEDEWDTPEDDALAAPPPADAEAFEDAGDFADAMVEETLQWDATENLQ